jgi:hypothetical protein
MPSVDLGLRGVTAFAYSEIAGARKSIDLNDNRSEALLRRGAVSVVMVADVKSNTPIGDGGIVFLMKPTM